MTDNNSTPSIEDLEKKEKELKERELKLRAKELEERERVIAEQEQQAQNPVTQQLEAFATDQTPPSPIHDFTLLALLEGRPEGITQLGYACLLTLHFLIWTSAISGIILVPSCGYLFTGGGAEPFVYSLTVLVFSAFLVKLIEVSVQFIKIYGAEPFLEDTTDDDT